MKGISVLVLLLSTMNFYECKDALEPISQNSNFYSNVIVEILQTYYLDRNVPVQINWLALDPNKATNQDDLINQVLRSKSEKPNLMFHMANILQRKPFFYNLIFVDGYAAFVHLMRNFSSAMYDFSGLYTIVMNDAPVNFDVISKIFSDLWSLGIANTILLNAHLRAEQEVIRIFSYFPYTPGYCGVANPILIHSVYFNDIDNSSVNLFRNRFKTFHNCSLTVGTFEIRPFIIIDPTEDTEQPKISGFEADLMKIVSERLNFHPIYRFTPNKTQWGILGKPNDTGLMNMVYRGEVDIGIGCLSLTKERYELLKAGTSHYTAKLVFAIPAGRLYTPLEKLLRPFESKMWIAIGLCISLAVVAVICIENSDLKHYFLDKDGDHPIINLINIVFGNSILTSTEKCSARVVLFSWIYYCFVVRSVYQSLLFQYLQQEQRWPQVETIDDIEKEKLTYYMSEVDVRFFETTPYVLNRTEFLPQESDSLSKALERLARGVHHGVVLVPFDSIAYHNKYKSEVGMISRMKNELRILPLGMHYPKKSPLPEVFDKIIADLQPSGLINFFADSYGTYAYVQEDQNSQGEPIPLNTEHLLGCYVLYLMLNGAAIVVFICEVSCKKIGKKYRFV
uniref:ionotropic receptor 7e precursor n=1 Tax=Aedes aegypti TaxID=7159 RepID=UPI000C29250E|nr:ionotropic receptor 7e precursor [Aedes aegypti]